jgi:hypothetical protein
MVKAKAASRGHEAAPDTTQMHPTNTSTKKLKPRHRRGPNLAKETERLMTQMNESLVGFGILMDLLEKTERPKPRQMNDALVGFGISLDLLEKTVRKATTPGDAGGRPRRRRGTLRTPGGEATKQEKGKAKYKQEKELKEVEEEDEGEDVEEEETKENEVE